MNVGYYAQLLMTLVWLPLGDIYSPGLVTATAALLLGILTIYGFAKGLMALNDLGKQDHGLQSAGDRRGPGRLRHLQRPAAGRRRLRLAALRRPRR